LFDFSGLKNEIEETDSDNYLDLNFVDPRLSCLGTRVYSGQSGTLITLENMAVSEDVLESDEG
jgi:hypothetical protein